MNVETIKNELKERLTDLEDRLKKADGGSVQKGVLQVEVNTVRGIGFWIEMREMTVEDLMADDKILHDYGQIRQNILEGINRFVCRHQGVGHFITAVLSNDLREALARADADNRKTIFQIVSYCHNEIPGVCWGTPEKVKRWIDQGPNSTPHLLSPENPKELDRQTSVGVWCATHHKQETQGGPGLPAEKK